VFAANADDPDAKRAPSRVADLITPDRMQFQPPVPAKSYLDGFGNVCHVIHAPAGRITISSDFLVRDSGAPDDIAPNAKQHALDKLPVETLVYLLGSRYCETDQFMNVAWAKFGNMAKGWSLVQAICDYVHDHVKFGYEHESPTKTAWQAHTERRGVCRDFAHLAITLCRCMKFRRAIAPVISATSVCHQILRRWISAPGLRSISATVGTPSMLATTSPVSVAF
jgi:transglutaminase-like putative cysteine protease